jgi:hypothetical protein
MYPVRFFDLTSLKSTVRGALPWIRGTRLLDFQRNLPQCDMHLLRPHHGNRKALSMLLLASLQPDSMLLLSPASPDPLHRHHHTPPTEIL